MITPEKEASALLARLKITTLPIPVADIARKLGITISYKSFEDISGVLIRDGKSVGIVVNSLHHDRRQRFTIAHELGHFVLHPGRPMIIDHQVRVNLRDTVSSMAVDADEIAANRFAAALLMPRDLLTRHVRELPIHGQLENALSTMFNVSSEAMSYRLINLGLKELRE